MINIKTQRPGFSKIVIRAALMLLGALFSSADGHAQWVLMNSDADSAVRRGSAFIYNIQFDSASVEFDKVKRLYPEHPVGYFMDAMVDWWKITTNKRSKAHDRGFLRKIDTVLQLCDLLLENNEHDIVGLFFKGGALGYRGRYYVSRRQWVRAASDGKEALDIVMEAWRIAPGNSDVLLGIGIYHYFAEALPERYPVVKPLMLFLPPGSKRSGVKELELAAAKARYADTEAKVVLLQIYAKFENDHEKTRDLAAALFTRFPRNSVFHKYLGRSLVHLGRRSETESTWREILKRCIARETGYDNLVAREAMYYVGDALMKRREHELALKYLLKCDEFSRKLDDDPSGFMVLSNLKMGNIFDRQGKRELALKQYEKVLDWDEFRNSHRLAEQYRRNAFR